MAISAGRKESGRNLEPRFGERLAEPLYALGGRAKADRAAHEADAAVAERDEYADRLGDDLAVVRRDAMLGIVDPRRPDADIAHAQVLAERGEIVILRDRRQQHRADRPLL